MPSDHDCAIYFNPLWKCQEKYYRIYSAWQYVAGFTISRRVRCQVHVRGISFVRVVSTRQYTYRTPTKKTRQKQRDTQIGSLNATDNEMK